MRVYQYAKQCGLKTQELLRILDENGIYNKSYQSNITEEEIKKVLLYIEQEDTKIPIKPIEINSKDYYDVNTELVKEFPEALYYFALSPRGVGKSTNGVLLALKTYIDEGNPSCLLRREEVELNAGKLGEIFGEIIALGYITYWTNGRYNSIHTVGMRSYLCKRDEDGKLLDRDKTFFLYAIPLSQLTNFKGIQLNRASDNVYVRWIIFDELIPADGWYLPNEASLFFNTISTIIRHYDKAKIICFGNTIVGSPNPILTFMGIDVLPPNFKVGEKRLYKYESDIEEETNYVCVHLIDKKEYKGINAKNNKYFNFGNKKLAAITGEADEETGIWEISKSYAARPRKFTKKDIVFTYYWILSNKVYQADIIKLSDCMFIYNHVTGHIYGDGWLNEDKELIFSQIYDPRPNWICKLNSSITNKKVKKIIEIIKQGKCYHQNAWVANFWDSLCSNM